MGSHIDCIGKKYGMLTVIDEFGKNVNGRNRLFLKCVCDCGNATVKEKSKVLRADSRSCGCMQAKMRKGLGDRMKKGFGEATFNETYGQYKKGARMRGYAFELSKEQFREIITQPCIYCGETLTQEKTKRDANGTFKYTGIDRYDNTKGYTLDNAVPCCCKCNRIKTNMSIEEFEKRLTMILERKDHWKRTALAT